MDQEASESSSKPVLNVKTFQRLLAAAYLLQVHSDRTHHDQAQLEPTVAERTGAFAAGAIVQSRTQSRTQRRPPHLSEAEQSAPVITNILPTSGIVEAQPAACLVVADRISLDLVSVDPAVLARSEVPGQSLRYAGRRIWSVRHMAPQSKATLWRAVDALAISAVFLAIVGVSIHGLWASRGSMPSGVLSAQEARSTAGGLPSSQHPAEQVSRPSLEQTEANVIAEDTVIRYPVRAVSAAKKPRNTGILAADAVVHYGSDVKMWSGNPKRTGLEGLGR